MSQNSYTEEEKNSYINWINDCLAGDDNLKSIIPISKSDNFFKACGDGILLCKLINVTIPETIDERVISFSNLSHFKINLNRDLCINSAKSIGCNLENITRENFDEGSNIMDLTWQIIRNGFFSKLTNQSELFSLFSGESFNNFMKFSVEEILIRWINFHLAAGGSDRKVNNLTNDIKDSIVYTVLLKQIAPPNSGVNVNALKETNIEKRAGIVLENANKIGCKKFLLNPTSIVNGSEKLNLLFVANLFNSFPGLGSVEEEIPLDREELVLRNWMNSLGVYPFVNNLFSSCSNGSVIIQLLDKINPGLVDSKQIQVMNDGLEKCNYAIHLANKDGYELSGMVGKQIFDGDQSSIFKLIWQLMRRQIFSKLHEAEGKKVKDSDINNWANQKLQASKGYNLIDGFKDSRIKSGIPLIDLIDAIYPKSVDYDLVYLDDEGGLDNSKLAISYARTFCTIHAFPMDIVDLKSQIVANIFASLMCRDIRY